MRKSFTKATVAKNMRRVAKIYPHLNEGIHGFRKTLDKIAENYNKLAFPYHPNWSYCIPLVPNYKLKDGSIVDIGIHLDDEWLLEGRGEAFGISANFVTSNEGPDYGSGYLSCNNETSKKALLVLQSLDIINESFIMNTIGRHNAFLRKFMESDLTSWDLQEWIDEYIERKGV